MGYVKDFRKVVHGYAYVEADTEQEAERKFEDGEFDEWDNTSEYEYDAWRRDA